MWPVISLASAGSLGAVAQRYGHRIEHWSAAGADGSAGSRRRARLLTWSAPQLWPGAGRWRRVAAGASSTLMTSFVTGDVPPAPCRLRYREAAGRPGYGGIQRKAGNAAREHRRRNCSGARRQGAREERSLESTTGNTALGQGGQEALKEHSLESTVGSTALENGGQDVEHRRNTTCEARQRKQDGRGRMGQ